MSKYNDKTFEKILDEMCKRVKECSTMEGSFILTLSYSNFLLIFSIVFVKICSLHKRKLLR